MIYKKICFSFLICFVFLIEIITGKDRTDKNSYSLYDVENKELFESYDGDSIINVCTDDSLDDLLKKLDEIAQLKIFENEIPNVNESDINELKNELDDEMINDVYQKNLIKFDNGTFEPDEYTEYDGMYDSANEEEHSQLDHTNNDCLSMGSFNHQGVMNEIMTMHNNLGVMSEYIIKMQEQLQGLVNQYNAYNNNDGNDNENCEIIAEDMNEMYYHSLHDKMQEMQEYTEFLTMMKDAAVLEWLELADGKKPSKKRYATRTHEKIKNTMPKKQKKHKKEQHATKKYSVSQCPDCMQNHTNGCSKCRFNKKSF